MVNFYERIQTYPDYCRRFTCGDSLITVFNCPAEARLMPDKFTSMWSKYNYIFYVLEGKKIWHTAEGSYEIKQGSCVFVRKGAWILEQFFDIGFCLVLFFIPDEFVCEVLKTKSKPISSAGKKYERVMVLNTSETLDGFFASMFTYFSQTRDPDQSLLELKFKELILTLADNPLNAELLSYFCSLLHEPQAVSLQRVMDDNFCFNLKLEQYAELSNRSLSAFKRDFQKLFATTPGKWLLEKRLNHAMHLLGNMKRTVSEAAFESGFENPSHFSRSFRQHFGVAPATVKHQIST
jgi:AraC family transcriptional regulator, exoenzyme S synthesis regulatory protein ExsA